MELVLKWLSGQGPVGVIAILLALALLYQTAQLQRKDAQLDRKDSKLDGRDAELVKIHEERLKDQQAMGQVLDRVTTSAKELALETSRLVSEQIRANDQVKAALAAQTRELEDLTKAVDKALQGLAQQQQLLLLLKGKS